MDKIARLLRKANADFDDGSLNGTPWDYALKLGTLNEKSNSNLEQ